MLVVEVDGVEYPRGRHHGPLLPVFKTAELSWDTLTEISRYLAADECSLTNGPIFNDYHSSTPAAATNVLVSAEEAEIVTAPPVRPDSLSELRDWSLADGKSIRAGFVTTLGTYALLKNEHGRQIKVPLDNFSDEDHRRIRLATPPTLDIEFSKKTSRKQYGDTYRGEEKPLRNMVYTFSARIKKTSIQPYGLDLTAEYFAIGDEVGGNKHILLEHRKEGFSLTKENNYTFEFTGKPIELIDYNLNDEHRGQQYGGYVVIVKDARGRIIAHRESSASLLEVIDNLQKLKTGWYFDRNGNRCLPTPPRPWVAPTSTN
jgi:hypothetical protein